MVRNAHWDERMFFPSWNQGLVDKLLVQQTDLKKRGVERQVLILMDDVVLTGRDADQLAHMCLRGRHFNVSVMMAAVSYTSICKRARRCLDFLLVYSCPMSGDRKILSWEYASNSHTADFALSRLEENQCVVFETSRKKQKLFNWRAQLLRPEDFRKSSLPALRKSGGPSRDSWRERRHVCRRRETSLRESRTVSEEAEPEPSGSGAETPEHSSPAFPQSASSDPEAAPASNELRRSEFAETANDGGR